MHRSVAFREIQSYNKLFVYTLHNKRFQSLPWLSTSAVLPKYKSIKHIPAAYTIPFRIHSYYMSDDYIKDFLHWYIQSIAFCTSKNVKFPLPFFSKICGNWLIIMADFLRASQKSQYFSNSKAIEMWPINQLGKLIL